MRERRLKMDWEKMKELRQESDLISFALTGTELDRYVVSFSCQGLLWLPGTQAPSVSARHQCEIYLHLNYPRNPPQLKWLTEIFHPNILPPSQNGGVCIGAWTPAETLAQLCVRLAEMIQMKNYSVNDPLNIAAALWARKNTGRFPVDARPILKPEPQVTPRE